MTKHYKVKKNHKIKNYFSFILMSLLAVPINTMAKTVLSTGYDYSEGSYGSNVTTTIDYSYFSAKYIAEQWSVKVTLPWLKVSSPANTVINNGGIITTNSVNTSRTTERGMGDVVVGFTWNLTPFTEKTKHLFDFSTKIKLATADEAKGLGTGEVDYQVKLDYIGLDYGQGKKWMPMASLAYKVFGQPNAYSLNPVWSLSLGTQYNLSTTQAAGLIWDGREQATTTSDSQSEVMAYYSLKLNQNWKTLFYAVKGFSDSSVDKELGLSLSYSFGQ